MVLVGHNLIKFYHMIHDYFSDGLGKKVKDMLGVLTVCPIN